MIIKSVNLNVSKFAVSLWFASDQNEREELIKLSFPPITQNYYHSTTPQTLHFNSNFDAFASFASDP